MDDVIKYLKTRRSCKSYLDKEVPSEYLDDILEVGLNAPSGHNRQDVIFLCVTNKDIVKKLSKMNADVLNSSGDPFYNAPCVIVCFGDSLSSTYVEDASLAIGQMIVCCNAHDLGCCWIHRAKEVFETEEGKKLKAEFNISQNYVGVGNLIIGYKDKEPINKVIKKDRIRYIK